jgi:hypothetical protein
VRIARGDGNGRGAGDGNGTGYGGDGDGGFGRGRGDGGGWADWGAAPERATARAAATVGAAVARTPAPMIQAQASPVAKGVGGGKARPQREREAEGIVGRGFYPTDRGQVFRDANLSDKKHGPGDPSNWPTFTNYKFSRTDPKIDFQLELAFAGQRSARCLLERAWEGQNLRAQRRCV